MKREIIKNSVCRVALLLVMMVMPLMATYAQTYTVTFDANGGMGTMKPQTFTAGTPQALKSCKFYHFFYRFEGWKAYTSAGAVTYLEEETITITEDITLYAQWCEAGTVWRLTDEGIDFHDPEENERQMINNELSDYYHNLTNLNITEIGYTFHFTEEYSDEELENLFDLFGYGTPLDVKRRNSNDCLLSSGDVLTGYGGQHTDIHIMDKAIVTFASVIRLFAVQGNCAALQIEDNATIALDGNNYFQIVSSRPGLFCPNIFIAEGKTLSLCGNGTLTIDGLDDCACIEGGNLVISEEVSRVTINASRNGIKDCTVTIGDEVFDLDPYSSYTIEPRNIHAVRFDANGGEGTMHSQLNTGSSLTLNTCRFNRDGYRCSGWNTKADGTGTDYAFGQTITASEDLTLYAQWAELIPGSIVFNANGGNGTMADQTFAVVQGQNIDLNINACSFTRLGYTFTGWNTKSDGSGTAFTDRQAITVSESVVLFAQWEVHDPATITLDSNSGYVELDDGDVLTGIGGTDTHVVIKDGAVVTVKDVTNTRVAQRWAGITCVGDATIYLTGDNDVKGGVNSSAIFVPKAKTLTIRGDGTLNAIGGTFSAGIGGSYGDEGNQPCGNIVIEGGTITATGEEYAAGIGGAKGGSCGSITIGPEIMGVTATTGGSSVPIGKGNAGTCGTVNIDPDLIDEMSGSTRTIHPITYNLWLGDRQVHKNNMGNILGDGTASFDPETATLRLKHPTKNMAIRSEGIDLTVKGIYKMTEAVDGMALDVKGGTLTLVGSFTLRGSVNGVEVDNNVSVRGLLRSYGTSGAGIHYVGTVDDRKLTLVPGFVSPTLVELTGSTAALSYTDGHYFRITTNGCCLAEPVGGIISPMPYDILDSNHDTATYVVLTLKGTAAGVGTESDPYQINSAEDWAKACEDVTYGCSTAGKYFRICSSFTATSVMGPLGNPFAGVIDGGSEFFTVTADIDEEYVGTALFHSVSDATIRNLCVKGSIRGGNGSTGIVGEAVGGATTMENCVFSGTVSTVDGSPADNWIVGAKAEGATVTTVNCLDASQHHWGDGSRAYSVTGGTNISLTKTGETGIAYDRAIWAPKDATVQFITAGDVGPYAPTAGTLSGPEGGVYSLTMPEEDVLILPNSWVSHTISYPGKDDENPMVTGGTVSVRSSAPAGTSILINVTPDPYYLLDELTVTTDPGGGAAGEPVEVDYDHFFRMPASNVKVTATFKKKYTFEDGVLTLKYGTFNKLGTNGIGLDVTRSEVTKITADPGVRFTEDCGGLFSGFTECTEIDLSNVETSELESTAMMFGSCDKLEKLNLSGWNTAQVRDMSDMFYGCGKLGELDLSGFVFAAGVDVTGMFSLNGLYKLTLPPAVSVTKEMQLNKGNHDNNWVYSGWQLLGNRNVVSTVSDVVYDSNNQPFTYAQLPGQLTSPTYVWRQMPDEFVLELPDGKDNRDLIALWDGMTVNVKLTGRTLYKDGKWNTLCLPFTLSNALDASYPAFDGAEFKLLDVAGKYNEQGEGFFGGDEQNIADYTIQTGFDEATGTLRLFFIDGSFEAGTPLLAKWPNGKDLVSPTFNNVTITKTMNDVNSDDGIVTFRGTYDYRSFPVADRSILFLGSNNTLFYPEGSAHIGPIRSYFKLVGVTADDLPANNIKMFFGDVTDGIGSIENGKLIIENEASAWYDLSGRKIRDERLEMRDSHSSSVTRHSSFLKKGIYVNNGKKIVIK